MVNSARQRGEEAVRLAPPGAQELVALINHDLARYDRARMPLPGPPLPGPPPPPSQVVGRVYWMVGLSTFAAIIDTVRTTLVELVAEMRAGSSPGVGLPSHEVAEEAVEVAVYGKRNRVVVNQVGADGAAAGGTASAGAAAPESRPRRLMWWLVGVAGLVAAAAAVAALLIS